MRYRYFVSDNKVVCVSSYAGKAVRGIAKCDPKDDFNIETGKELARLRCDVKIAEKRANRSQERYAEAVCIEAEAVNYRARMYDYMNESANELETARNTLEEFSSKI